MTLLFTLYILHMLDPFVKTDANSILEIEMKDRTPKLCYIYPTCFEAGKPMEFVACGSDLLQPKFRFLVSFAGRYLSSNISITSVCCQKGGTKCSDHQLLKICVPQTKMNLFGPSFIEENDFWVIPTSDGTLYCQSSQNQSICCSSHESGCTQSSGEYIHGLTPDEGLSCQFLC
ncbi:squamosa promoter-binding-like protein 7 [Primulina eburnea]|uniref:squamosa promoter-binding-like protein 7 n=1 Tax=Primulina eburnea TaxID=1245227 RepID=UPI003C6C018F